MKKVLVTGAAGGIGRLVIKYLLSEGKYEITALDLKNKFVHKTLKKYNRRVNVIYGDVTNPILIDELIKEHDYVIHLASINYSLSSLKDKICKEIEYKGSENIVRAITFYNPKCFLIYPSTTNVYGNRTKPISTKEKTSISEEDYYTKNKLNIEKLIKDKLNNYVIFRLPTILMDMKNNDFIYNTPLNNETEFVSCNDVSYALVKSIDKKNEINKKTYNLGGGKNCIDKYGNVLVDILKIYGISSKYLFSRFLLENKYYGNVYKDSQDIEEILHYQNDSISSYLMELKRKTKFRRWINRLFAKPFIYFINKKIK